mgnify:CR=1 FL=1
MLPNRSVSSDWPELPFDAWHECWSTLQLWTQVVGKIRLVQSPWVNHSWHVPLYVTARGLSTSPIAHGARVFQIDFDFIDHQLLVQTGEGQHRALALTAKPVATYYAELMAALDELGLGVRIHTLPNEIADAIPFEQDRQHHHYEPEAATSLWRALVQVDRVFKEFRAGFCGKCSPVHFFWGSFDLAVTRFSGRPAPPHPGGVPNFPDWVACEAYSQEVSSAGFWPGGGGIDYPAFYAYAYPAPEGFAQAAVRPEAAFYAEALGEFVLPYEAVRSAASPDETLLQFLHSSYAAAADLGNWDRAALECSLGPPAD